MRRIPTNQRSGSRVRTAVLAFSQGLVLAACLVWISSSAAEKDLQAHEEILAQAHSFLRDHLKQIESHKQIDGQNSEIHLDSLDPRLKLSRCDAPLEAFLAPGAKLYGKTTVGVRCAGSQPWKLFVPARLAVFENVLVTSRTILQGETLAAGDLNLVRREMGSASQSYLHTLQQAQGFVAKRAIPAGRILTAHMLEAPRLVKAGQEVILLAGTPPLEVRMKGKALSDGSRGDIIQVRNVRSKRVVEGVVTHAGIVRVNM